MNKDGILTTIQERKDYELDTEYKFIEKEGTYDLVLEYRAWGNNRIECYFFDDSNSDISIKAYLFVRTDENGNDYYSPRHSDIDFRYVEDNSIYRCTFRKNKKGFFDWDNAILL